MSDDTVVLLGFPSVGRKKLTAAFDGGRITSDGGVMLLAAAERRIGLAERLAALISDPRNPLLVTHTVADILRARMLAIACGYEDADDPDHLGNDPGFKLACGRLPDSGRDLCSQPTMSHWENRPSLREVIRLTFGSRVDCYAWGKSIDTTGFGGTSGPLTGKSQVTLIDVFRRALADPYDANRPELPPERFDRKAQVRVREILQNLGWKRGQRTDTDRLWVKPP